MLTTSIDMFVDKIDWRIWIDCMDMAIGVLAPLGN